jgi:RNA polymerase sigma-70 factor (ECF subfamily)
MLHGVNVGPILSDVELLRRARRDAEAFRVFYQRYAAPLNRWLAHQVDQPEVALDITAETFACALDGLDRFRPETGESAGPWLYGIAANLLRRYWAERALETRYRERLGILHETRFAGDFTTESAERLDAEALRERLNDALEELPAAYRAAVKLRVLDQRSYPDAAREMGCSETTARVRVHRGLRALHLRATREE